MVHPLPWHCHTKLQTTKPSAAAIPLLAFTAAPLLNSRPEVPLFASPLSYGCRSTRSPGTMRKVSPKPDCPVYGRFQGVDVVGLEWRTEPLDDEIPIPWLARACHGLSSRKLFARRKDLPASRDMYHSTIYVLLSFEAFLLFRSGIRQLFPWTARQWIKAPRRRIIRWLLRPLMKGTRCLECAFGADMENFRIPGTGGLALATVFAGLCGSSARAVIESPIEYAKVKRQTGQTWHFNEVYQGFFMQLPRTMLLILRMTTATVLSIDGSMLLALTQGLNMKTLELRLVVMNRRQYDADDDGDDDDDDDGDNDHHHLLLHGCDHDNDDGDDDDDGAVVDEGRAVKDDDDDDDDGDDDDDDDDDDDGDAGYACEDDDAVRMIMMVMVMMTMAVIMVMVMTTAMMMLLMLTDLLLKMLMAMMMMVMMMQVKGMVMMMVLMVMAVVLMTMTMVTIVHGGDKDDRG
ncbi:rep [Symbiodinium microadriaticum]|nr:rep [Symbiodinium microadriaticum]